MLHDSATRGLSLAFLNAKPVAFLCYSVLNAFIGEIDAARRAGIMAAKNAEIASEPAATPRAIGSQMEMPSSCVEISRPAPMQPHFLRPKKLRAA
jgi:hypothetical protein